MTDRAARHAFVWVLAFALALASPVSAQRVIFSGRGDPATDGRIRTFLTSGGLTVIARDTLLAPGDTIDGPVLMAAATVRIEGVIRGDLMVVDANVFVRPRGVILGNVTNVAGGFYPSERATLAAQVESLPNAPYDAVRDGDDVRIIGTRRRAALELDGFRGIRIPEYDRVDGVTAGIGGRYVFAPAGGMEPYVRGRAGYVSERGDWNGGIEIGAFDDATEIGIGAERATLTNEGWIRAEILNSLTYLWEGKDYYNHYEAERAYATFMRRWGPAHRTLEARLTAQAENASSLRADDPWSVLRPDSIRPNPPINEGRITSAILELTGGLERPTFIAEVVGAVEGAAELLGGDFSFGSFRLSGEFIASGIANHTLVVQGQFRGPLPGTDSLPRQRWTYLGGSGTLYTFDIGEFLGDRVVFARTQYLMPFPSSWRLPLLGAPSFDLLYHVGMAWPDGADRALEHNLGARLRFPFAFARVVLNPSPGSGDRVKFALGFTTPRSYAWPRPVGGGN